MHPAAQVFFAAGERAADGASTGSSPEQPAWSDPSEVGFRVSYSGDLRELDAGVLMLGQARLAAAPTPPAAPPRSASVTSTQYVSGLAVPADADAHA